MLTEQHSIRSALQWGGRRGYRAFSWGTHWNSTPNSSKWGKNKCGLWLFAAIILRGCKKCTVRPQCRIPQPTEVHQMLHQKSENAKESESLLSWEFCCCFPLQVVFVQGGTCCSPGLSQHKPGPGGSQHRVLQLPCAGCVCPLLLAHQTVPSG